MKEQLYRLKNGQFTKTAILGLLSLTIAACSEEATQQETSVDVSQPAAEQVAETATAAAESTNSASTTSTAPAEDAGFLNYDMVLGDANAPVEIIEYASITCNHCATFHNNVLPRIKEKYVDSGKVKIVTRSFLLNIIDVQGSAISRCVPANRYFAFMDAVFNRQTQWYNIPEFQRLNGLHDQETASRMFVDQTMDEFSKMARQVGLNKAKIDECLANEAINDYLVSIYQEGVEKHKVTATPTIIVNGNKTGNDYASIERAIEAELN